MVQLMCAQARACLFEKTELAMYDTEVADIDSCLELGQEAAHVSEVYDKVYSVISQAPVKDYVPYSWVSLVQVKKEHYVALANFYVALGLLDHEGDLREKTAETLMYLHDCR